MNGIKKRKCRHCRQLFVPDHRNQNRQIYCSKAPCRKASKAAGQQKWLRKPENKDYFKGPENVIRVREWRKKNPGYWKRSGSQTALQDLLFAQPPVIIGLISNFIGSPLQEDIAQTLLAMQQSGQDILCLQPKTQGGQSDGLNYSQVTDELGLDCRTVAKWANEERYLPRRSAKRAGKPDPSKNDIIRMLEKHPYTGRQIFQRIQENGFNGGMTIVTDYVRKIRPPKVKPYLKLVFAPGECAQVYNAELNSPAFALIN